MFQEVTLIGNFGQDPEMRYTPSGSSVTNFSMATSEKWTGQDGQPQERTTWWRVTAWGKLGEAINTFKKKGDQVMVKGRMNATPEGNPRLWKDNKGNDRASFEITATVVKFLGSNRSGNGTGDSQTEGEAQDESEIPF